MALKTFMTRKTYLSTFGLLNKNAHGAVGEGISEKCGIPTLYRKARSLET